LFHNNDLGRALTNSQDCTCTAQNDTRFDLYLAYRDCSYHCVT